MSKLHVGIFGPSLSGKSFLKDAVSRAMVKQGFAGLCFDPNGVEIGDHIKTYTDEAEFWQVVWSSQKCFVMVEESAETIKRNPDLNPLFTRIRHRGHKLCVTGHNAADLLPVMRRNITTLYLFEQTPKSCDLWYEDTTLNPGIYEAGKLEEYEFLWWEKKRKPKEIIKCRLDPNLVGRTMK